MWVFGYGSLMWDGWEKQFGCLRRPIAVLHGYRRTFNKASTENWGTREVPCPTLSLERIEGGLCKGIAFEFPDSQEASVRKYLVDREGKGFPLKAMPIRLEDDAEVQAWAPVYNGKNLLSGDMAQKAAMISRASGTKGTCRSYIQGIAKMLSTFGIDDPAVSELWKELNRLVKVQYVAIYKLHAVNKLPEAAEGAILFQQQHPTLSAKLTMNPEPHFLHIENSAALGSQILKGIFAPDIKGTLQERLSAEIEDMRASRAKRLGTGVFLIFEGETEISTPDFKARQDTEEFAVYLGNIGKGEIRKSFRPYVQSVIMALTLSLATNADRRVEKMGDVIYLVDNDNGKPIYTLALQGGTARASVSSPLSENMIEESAALAAVLAAHQPLVRTTSLLSTSIDAATDDLQGFIAAWSALEIFINATFKTTYEARWFDIMRDGAPASAKPVFERFKDVMSDKYRLADKFLVVASVLDSAVAAADATEFARLKKFRDGLLHALDTPLSPLPTEAVQKLLLKYMKLHLGTQG